MYQHMGLYKYTSGEFATFEQAQQHRNNVIAKGFKDAFVVAFRNGERIKTSEARAMTGR